MRAPALAIGLLATTVGATYSQALSPSLSRDSVAARFFNTPDEPLTRYRAARRLEATNSRFKKHGWLDVITELSPETGFTFHVLAEGGSPYIRTKVLLPILEGERALVARGDYVRSALTSRNHEVTGETTAENGLVRLLVKPLREETTLVDGALLVTEIDADLVRIQGRLAKNPSFWTRRVDIVRHYGRVAGVRVPLGVDRSRTSESPDGPS